MARASGRTTRTGAFPNSAIKDFYGKGIIKGTADVVYVYGPPGEPASRRLKISIELSINFPEGGMDKENLLGYSDNLLSEQDEPI